MTQRHPDQSQRLMFVTTNIKDRIPLFRDSAYAREAVEALYRIQLWNPFFLFGFVIMPDHCHFLMNVPETSGISKVMHMYKRSVSFAFNRGPIWQARFNIMFPRKPWEALQYIHQNPVEAGLCERSEDYMWSSACGRWDVTRLG
jgi:putative transposase